MVAIYVPVKRSDPYEDPAIVLVVAMIVVVDLIVTLHSMRKFHEQFFIF